MQPLFHAPFSTAVATVFPECWSSLTSTAQVKCVRLCLEGAGEASPPCAEDVMSFLCPWGGKISDIPFAFPLQGKVKPGMQSYLISKWKELILSRVAGTSVDKPGLTADRLLEHSLKTGLGLFVSVRRYSNTYHWVPCQDSTETCFLGRHAY